MNHKIFIWPYNNFYDFYLFDCGFHDHHKIASSFFSRSAAPICAIAIFGNPLHVTIREAHWINDLSCCPTCNEIVFAEHMFKTLETINRMGGTKAAIEYMMLQGGKMISYEYKHES